MGQTFEVIPQGYEFDHLSYVKAIVDMNIDYWIKVMWIELDSIWSLELIEAPNDIKSIVFK